MTQREGETETEAGRPTGQMGPTDRQTGRQTGRQTDRTDGLDIVNKRAAH